MEDAKSVILGVLSNLIYAGLTLVILALWNRYKDSKMQEGTTRMCAKNANANDQKPIVENSDWTNFLHGMLGHVFSVYLIYLALSLPVTLKASFNSGVYNLSDAYHIGHMLPSIDITTEWFKWVFVILTLLIYVPVMNIATIIISTLREHFPKMNANPKIRYAVHVLFVTLICTPIAATGIVLFFDKTYKEAFMLLFIFLVLFPMAASQQNRRQ